MAFASDYKIKLDLTECDDIEFISNRLSCQPPAKEADIERSLSDENRIHVVVSINITYVIELTYSYTAEFEKGSCQGFFLKI